MSKVIYKKHDFSFSKKKEHVLLVIGIDDNSYFEIDGEFVKLWDLIDGKLSQEDLIERFANLIEEDPAEIQEEVEKFLIELQEFNLIYKIP